MASKKKPVLVIRSQAVKVMKDALEKHGYKVTFEQWDGTTQTESFQVRSRGVDTLVIVSDPAYLSEPDPAPFVDADKFLLRNPRK